MAPGVKPQKATMEAASWGQSNGAFTIAGGGGGGGGGDIVARWTSRQVASVLESVAGRSQTDRVALVGCCCGGGLIFARFFDWRRPS